MPTTFRTAVKIEGLKEAVRELAELSAETGPALKVIALEAAEIVARDAAVRAPRRSGMLADSIRSKATSYGGAAVTVGGSGVPYAGVIHFGWGAHGIAAQPFLYRALDERHAEVFELYDHRLKALVEKTMGAV